jgi:hypothetical protein
VPGSPEFEALHRQEVANDAIAAANAGRARAVPGKLSPLGPPSGPFGGPGSVMQPAPNPVMTNQLTGGQAPYNGPPEIGTPVFAPGVPAAEGASNNWGPAAKSNNYGASSAGDKAIAAAQKDLAANESDLKKESAMGKTPGR